MERPAPARDDEKTRPGPDRRKDPARSPGRGLCQSVSGCVLLSHTVTSAVPSALKGLASGFGMEAGRFPFAMTAETLWRYQAPGCGGGCGVPFVSRELHSGRVAS